MRCTWAYAAWGFESNMRPRIAILMTALCWVVGAIPAARAATTVPPRALAGDWEYVVNPPLKLVLHIHVAAGGAMSGTVDVPGSPPKRIVLSNVYLVGNMLTYTMPPLGTVHEVVLPGGTKMVGPYMWVKAGSTVLSPPFEPLSRLAGDWESPTVGPAPLVLRLRLDAKGALTATIDVPEPMSQRVPLRDVAVSGRTLSYAMADGHTYQGAFSKDGSTVASTGMSTIDATWHHVRTAAQAAAREATANANPVNGDWVGTGDYTASFPGLGPSKGTATLAFHIRGDPASCVMKMVGSSDSPLPCRMTQSGRAVHMEVLGYQATFNGALSADGSHLSGAWMMGRPWFWTGPMHIDLTRQAPPQ